jgi:hypothetical protein
MTETQAIVYGAGRRCDGLLALGDTPTAAEAAEWLGALNGMMHGWKSKGVDTEHVTLTLSDDFPLDPEFEDGVTCMLAVRIAGQNGKQLSQQTIDSANSCWNALLAAYVTAPETSFDPMLARMPSLRLVTV